MNRKSWVVLLILVLVLTTLLIGCGKKTGGAESGTTTGKTSTESPSETSSQAPAGEGKVGGQIVIGSDTAADGLWNGWGYWANNATDMDVFQLMNYMDTVQYSYDANLEINTTVVADHEVKKNDDGSKTYTWKIKDGLTYHDGTPITAKDFVAGFFFAGPQIKLFEAKDISNGFKLVGYEDFNQGITKEFKGVRLLDDSTVSVTIAKEYLPDFYEVITVALGPTPLKAWLGEDADVKDDGNGIYFTGEFFDLVTIGEKEKDDKGQIIQPEPTEAQKALFEKFKGVIAKARDSVLPSAGPYVLKKFDKATKEVILERNDKYPGNYEGKTPKIQTVIIRETKAKTAMDQFKAGEVDLLRNMMSGDEINAGINISEETGKKDYIAYPRSGFGMIHFHCDFGPSRFKEVRQAVAHLLDRNDFVQRFTGGFGTVVDGPYGEGQWWYKEAKAELQSSLNHYSYSLEKAVELLEKVGYTLNEKGEPFTPGTDKMRYRKNDDGSLEPLLIKWASTADNPVSETLVVTLQKNKDVAMAGMVIEQDQMDFGALLGYYRRGGDDAKYKKPTYHMFNLASGFPLGNLPTKDFTVDPEEIAQGHNTSFLIDPEFDKLAKAIQANEPDDREGFKKSYVEYYKKWNELLPEIPLYSNTIHDFYDKKIHNYNNSSFGTMPMTLLDAYVE